ncbi:hypothetical protein [Tateyamaria omphalii]|uniref:Lipoprotein n=1 Tax=Tateyamaria omphalii TaxID=299262 RepID=A0A1P8MQV0_9RHOB|nr:hypothetical protein [Tateyamaria omphalii]APX10421.1 hypothetical protein BWR18_00925 [Tateyamaria omphalii]
MFKVTSTLVLTLALAVSGCAQKAENVTATYVSPLQFQSLNCTQLRQEATRISLRASEVSGVQDKKAKGDATATAVALVLFWPAAFFIKGDKATAAELGRLKGEMQALEAASTQRGCGVSFQQG